MEYGLLQQLQQIIEVKGYNKEIHDMFVGKLKEISSWIEAEYIKEWEKQIKINDAPASELLMVEAAKKVPPKPLELASELESETEEKLREKMENP